MLKNLACVSVAAQGVETSVEQTDQGLRRGQSLGTALGSRESERVEHETSRTR
jgi:hypothetical protein